VSGAAPESAPAPAVPESARPCPRCGAPLVPGQDWCLQCGAGAPGSLGQRGGRPAAWILAVTAALVLGAAAAGYAALDSSAPKAPTVTRTVAQVAAPTTTPSPATPLPTTAPTTTVPPLTSVKAPKIPLSTPTPKASGSAPGTATATPTTPATGTPATPTTPTPSSGAGSEENQPQAIVLDTNAASTYNPYSLPASSFGDPSLAIDGDTSTGWSATVEPATAPKLAEGLLIDLKSGQRISAAAIVTSTPGITVQFYGANVSTPPSSITDPAWVALSHSIVVHKRHIKVALKEDKHSFRFITLWLSAAPRSDVGTPTAPAHVSINELELFPAA
jgi:hypothetical protein